MSEQLPNSPASSNPDYDYHALAWESDGTSQKKYCQQHGLSYSHFVTARVSVR